MHAYKASSMESPASLKSLTSKQRVDSIKIEGMTCHSCVRLIESTVGKLSGVTSVHVSLERKEGVVEYKDGLISREQIRKTIDDMGFVAASITGEHLHTCMKPYSQCIYTNAGTWHCDANFLCFNLNCLI